MTDERQAQDEERLLQFDRIDWVLRWFTSDGSMLSLRLAQHIGRCETCWQGFKNITEHLREQHKKKG